MTDPLVRFSVTMPQDLLNEFDQRIERDGKGNRSEVLRGLVRNYITEERWQGGDSEVYGTATLLYDHHALWMTRNLTQIEHEHNDIILCSTHVHLTPSTCLECILFRGQSSKIQSFFAALRSIRGIKSFDTVIMSDAG